MRQFNNQPDAMRDANSTKTGVTAASLDALRATLLSTPAPERALTTTEALRQLAPDLAKMRADGHTVASITEALRSGNFPVSARAVARALAHVGAARRARRGPRPISVSDAAGSGA